MKGKQNIRKKLYFIKDDTTSQQAEIKSYYRDLKKENEKLKADEQFILNMKKGQIYANNQAMTPAIQPPSHSQMLRLSDDQYESVKATKVTKCSEHVEGGSEFYSYVAKASSKEDIEKAYLKLRIKFADATHIVCAYRMEEAKGPYLQQAIDDGEIGGARRMLQQMQDRKVYSAAIFIIRYYGGQHLGKRRFEIYQNLTDTAIKTWRQ